jgi:hypothetical protein
MKKLIAAFVIGAAAAIIIVLFCWKLAEAQPSYSYTAIYGVYTPTQKGD